jgi:hypothetical protein
MGEAAWNAESWRVAMELYIFGRPRCTGISTFGRNVPNSFAEWKALREK